MRLRTAVVTACAVVALGVPAAAGDEFTVKSEWLGTFTRTAPPPASTTDVRLVVTKRDGEKFTAEYWTGKGVVGVEIEGTVGRNGAVAFKVTRKLKGEPAKGVVGAKFTGDLDGSELTGDVVVPPGGVGKLKLRLKSE